MPSAASSRRGFTLFELILVVLLIAILYGVFINKLATGRSATAGKQQVTLGTLRGYLALFRTESGEVSLICPEPCGKCGVFVDGEAVEDAELTLFKQAPTVYRRDRYGQFEPRTFRPLQQGEREPENVCFAFTLWANDSSSSDIVEADDVFYVFDAYGEPTQTFKTLEDAAEAYNRTELIPDDKRVYDF